MKTKIKTILYPQLFLVYLVIFFQYPFGLAIGKFVYNLNLFTNIQPGYLLLWGSFRLLVVLPLIFSLLSTAKKDHNSIFLQLGEKDRMISLTFWGTLIFTLLGIFLYPLFIKESALTIQKIVLLFPIFSLYAISNAFVEETFFRGVSLSILNEKYSFWLSNLIQALFFAAIHFVNPMSSNLLGFVLLTFALGLLWGYITKKTKSLIPAIVLHIIADLFVAISLF